uniref:ParD-like antitoxin of type II toxin-antitoxin system n=1 Tax=uncultured Thiotrichaceae bacterium TaxID=298394 RepID=A0A6S6U6W1_9GAMM|nr:MAG: Unknown protein [uncultured Thiotrichaceae bacterium]
MTVSIKLSTETVESAKKQAKIFKRTLSEQVNYWAHIGQLAERHPDLTLKYLQELMREDRLEELENNTSDQKQFNAIRLKTQGYRFDREEANARQTKLE